jgi:membrane-associated protease RseP (regulator of RpoE activity)
VHLATIRRTRQPKTNDQKPQTTMLPTETDQTTPLIARVLKIEDVTWGDTLKGFVARYRGKLYSEDSEAAYDQLAESLKALDLTPLFRLEDGQHVIYLKAGVVRPKPSNIRWNVLMFVLTVISVVFTGAANAYEGPADASFTEFVLYTLAHLGAGLPFAISMMTILLAHEFGHYIAGRIHKTEVTLPYYIPLPWPISPFGTMGAFIQMKEIPKNRRHLLDIGIAGPLAGLLVAIPILILGLITSPVSTVEPLEPGQGIMFEGNSILYAALKFVIKGEWLPSAPSGFIGPDALYNITHFFTGGPAPFGGRDVTINGIAWAGWAGLLVTALNLIPAGQLDGGHLLYVLLGKRAAKVRPFVLGLVLLLGLVWPGWLLWAFLIFVFGRIYAEPLDLITPLDQRRKALAIVGLLILVLIFTPVPLTLAG